MKESHNFKLVLAAACMSLVLFGISITTLGSILPFLITRFGLTELDVGTLASLLPVGLLLGSLLFGPIVDRYSYRKLLVLCSGILLLSLEGIAYATSFEVLGIYFFLIGAGGGAINGGASALVADISSGRPNARGANLSLIGVFFGLGALGMPALLGLLSAKFGYQDTLMVVGVAMGLPIIYFIFTSFPPPKQTQKMPLRESLVLTKDLNLILFGLILFFQSGIEGLVNNWSTSYLIQVIGSTESQALYGLSTFVLSLTLTRAILALILGPVRPYLIMIISFAMALGGSFVLTFTLQYEMALLGLAMMGMGLAAGFPVILGYVGDIYAKVSGTAFSLVFVIAIIGNILWNFLMGYLTSFFGFGALPRFIILSIVLLGGLLYITISKVSDQTRV